MQKKIRILAIILCLALVAPILNDIKVNAAVTDQDINDAKNEQEKINKRLEEAQAQLKELNAARADIERYVKELDKKLEAINVTIDDLAMKMDNKQIEINKTEAELLAAKEDEAEQYEAMKLRIQYMYETGQTTYLEAFLASESISDLLNRTEYIKSITEYDKQMMDKLVETKERIQATDDRLKKEYGELKELKIASEAELAAAELMYATKQEELALAKSKAEEAAKLEAMLAKELEEADKEIDRLIAQKKKEEDEARQREMEKNLASKTFLGWPLPTSNRVITDTFGPRIHPILGYLKGHNGVDIAAATGTPVYAAAAGTVMVATYNYSYGNYILLYHEGGYATLYAHSSKLLVSVGDKVKKGDKIMLVGSTGYSTGPHLHFELRLDGTRIDPLKYYNTEGLTYR